jgi:hypothetical protein
MAIKVYIPLGKFRGGPAVFSSRLVYALNDIDDIKIVTDVSKKFDVGLEFIRKTEKYKQPYILRASSCYYFNNYKPWNNKPIAASIKNASHTIFQSEFAYKLCNRVLRLESRDLIKNGHSIIYNGIDMDYIDSIEPSKDIEEGSFVSCARWDSNKRIHSMLKGFLEADIKKHLYVIGDYGIEDRKKDLSKLKKKYGSKYIHILGKKSNKEVISIMKACEYQLHLSFIDICPNTVLEGLACGLNILYCNLGGTSELIGKNGVVLNVDKFWDTRYLKKKIEDLDNLKSKVVAKGIYKLIKIKTKSDISKFKIDKISKKYVKAIRKVLE